MVEAQLSCLLPLETSTQMIALRVGMRWTQASFHVVYWRVPSQDLGDLDLNTRTSAPAGYVHQVDGPLGSLLSLAFPVGCLCHPGICLGTVDSVMLMFFAFQELCRQQRSFQTLDQECTQMKVKLTQELQQAKNAHNILQAELDKVGTPSLPFSLSLLFLSCS